MGMLFGCQRGKTSANNGMQLKSSIISFYMSKPCDALKFSTRSEEEEYWTLRPLRQQMPAKEIITQKYSKDVVPQVKLMVNNDDRKNNLNFVPPKTRCRQLQGYVNHFNQFDYLGHYCASKANQIVYLKFNNGRYNQVVDAKQRTKVMSAFYVPFQQIYSQSEALFTKNLGLKFPQATEDAVLPVAKNNKGCSLDAVFCSQFDTGNLFAAIRKSPFDYELIIQNDVNSCTEVCWFNFSVEFKVEGYYTFCIKNMTKNMTKLFERGLKICYCFLNNLKETIQNDLADDWNHCGENISYTKNNIEIQGEPGEYYYDLYFEYKCKNKGQILQFAMDKPYKVVDSQKYFTETAMKKIKGLTKIEKIQYGKTISGSPLSAYHIRKRRTADTSLLVAQQGDAPVSIRSKNSINPTSLPNVLAPIDNGRRSVMILGRLGGADVSSSSVMEGMVDFLLETMDYDFLKRTVNFYFVPMTNIDSVKYGNSLTNLTGSSCYDDWRSPHKVYQAEIYRLKTFMAEINKDSPITHVFSFASESKEIYSSVIGTKSESEQCEDSRIFPFVLSKRHRMLSFENCSFHDKDNNSSMTSVLTEMFPKVLAYEINVSRFELEKQPEEPSEVVDIHTAPLRQCKHQNYFNFGRKFMEDYLEHVKIYDKNSLLKNKWLRQIEEMQEKQPRKEPIVMTQRSVEERFPERFIHIRNLNLKTPARSAPKKLLKKFDPYSLSRSKKTIEMGGNLTPGVRRHQNLLVRYFFDNMNNDSGAGSIDETLKKTIHKGTEKSLEKPQQFRIRDRTNEVLKNCNNNLMNFELGIVSQERMKKDHNSPYMAEKDRLKKQLSRDISLKKLKKIRADHMPRPQPKQNLGEFMGNFLKP